MVDLQEAPLISDAYQYWVMNGVVLRRIHYVKSEKSMQLAWRMSWIERDAADVTVRACVTTPTAQARDVKSQAVSLTRQSWHDVFKECADILQEAWKDMQIDSECGFVYSTLQDVIHKTVLSPWTRDASWNLLVSINVHVLSLGTLSFLNLQYSTR